MNDRIEFSVRGISEPRDGVEIRMVFVPNDDIEPDRAMIIEVVTKLADALDCQLGGFIKLVEIDGHGNILSE